MTPTPINVFGQTFERALHNPILVIGSDTWDRLELAEIGITQLRACRAVSVLAADVRAKQTADLYARVGPASLAGSKGIGLHCLFVIWRVFEAKGLDPSAWYWKGREGAVRTFTTLKGRAIRDEARIKREERRARRRRSAA